MGGAFQNFPAYALPYASPYALGYSPFNNRGVAYKKQGDYDRALQDFNAALFIDSNYGEAIANRAEIYQAKRDYPSALKDLGEAIRIRPELPALFNER